MSSNNKTLADVQPGGRVRLGDQAERARFEAWLDYHPLVACSAGMAWQVWQAALSAQPSPGGQDALASLPLYRLADDANGNRGLHRDDTGSWVKLQDVERAIAARQPVGEHGEGDEFLAGVCLALQCVTAQDSGVLWAEIVRAVGVDDLLQYATFTEPAEWDLAGFSTYASTELNRRRPRSKAAKQAKRPRPQAVEAAEAYRPAQAVDLGRMPHGIRLVEIPRRNGLDPINVFVQDYELGRGRIVVTCYGQAWCGFWGAMGDRTVMQFVAACDADYVAGNMLSGRHEHVKKHERAYVERIATEVIAEFRALIDSQAVGK